MRTSTIQEFKAFARANARLASAVCLAQAYAQCERERVDAYVQPIFDGFEFFVNPEWVKSGQTERITKPKDLYLSAQEPLCAEFYAALDVAHRAHGFRGETGFCPALVAEDQARKAEGALLDAGCNLLGIEQGQLYGENRKKMLDLLLGACIKVNDERRAA